MMDREILQYCLDSLSKAGVEKSQCVLKKNKKYEMNTEGVELSLLRTTIDVDLNITAIQEGRKGSISLNKIDHQSLDDAINSVLEILKTSSIDEANDISPKQQTKEFSVGDMEPDMDRMHQLVKGYITTVKETYPKIVLMESALSFNSNVEYFVNSNGVDFKSYKGFYDFSSVFSSKDGEKSSSFNYTGFSMNALEKDLLDCGSLKTLLKESIEQLNTKPLEGKFVGDVILTPDCLESMIQYYIATYLSDRALISGTSVFKDKLNNQVASPKLTIHANPTSNEISGGYFVTNDGFEAEDVTIIDKGTLKSFMLSFYGANKTKLERAKNTGGAYIVEPGDKSLAEMIKGIEKGVLVSRYSGGNPSANGDFSGVAKNSYYIENGEIKYPLSETMIAGNLADLLMNIKDISKERINYGAAILPWIWSQGVTISGK